LSYICVGLGWFIIPFLLRENVENTAIKSQFDFALVKLEKIQTSISTEILVVGNSGDMELVTHLTQLMRGWEASVQFSMIDC